jgi:hypothetical protein
MKIKLTKDLKIELLRAVQSGCLDTNNIPEIMAEVKNIEPFLDLMKRASVAECTQQGLDDVDAEKDKKE